jgi:hypothetical protein
MINETRREIVTTNFKIYKAIADEAHEKMVHLMEMGRRPNPEGSGRWTITRDPNMTSFKHAIISIVFTGVWLDACLHLLLVRKCGKSEFEKMKLDKPGKTYEIKLKLLGCTDEKMIADVERFREMRNSLVHEKAYFDREITIAQNEASVAQEMLIRIEKYFMEQCTL